MSDVGNSLVEVTTKERIALVEGDRSRKYGQIVIAFILIGFALSFLGYYTLFQADDSFKLSLANDMRVLVIMGIGAALAIFGLGRTVGRPAPRTIVIPETRNLVKPG